MPAEIRLPFTKTPAQQVSPGVWRKRVLPVGKIEYQGRVINFDRPYLETLAQSYQAGAYDQVPFQLADAKNSHTNDPERFRGEIDGVEVRDDGLWVTMRPTPEGNKVLMANPKLGVSARIVEDYARADGQYFPVALQHVLGTLDPRITGLGAWESVNMANAPEMIIDLSAAMFAGEEGGSIMPELDAGQQEKLAKLLELDPDRLSALVDGLADISVANDNMSGGDDLLTDDDLVAAINAMSDEEFAQVAAEYDVGTEPAYNYEQPPQLVGAGAGAQFANEYGLNDIELANYRLAETERQMAVLQRNHDAQAFENEKRRLLNLGVPLYVTDLARPLLEGTGKVVEMSNGQGVDAGLVMRRVLTEMGKAASMLDMSSELGSSMDEPDMSVNAEQRRGNRVSEIRGQLGI